MNSDQAARLRDWADAYVAGNLRLAEREALERELLTSDEAQRFFLSYLELHAGLAWQFRGLECKLPFLRAVQPTRASASPWWRWSLPWAAAAAMFGLAAAVWLSLRDAPRQPGADLEPGFAVRETLRGRWADGREVRVSDRVGRGGWSLQNGLISLAGADGVEVLVEGPAVGEWLGAQHLRLTSGTVVVRMPKGRSGFVVETAQMRVIDLGTEFGVSVSQSGDERVQVYDGLVRTEATASGAARELKAGSGLRCSAAGELAPAAFVEDRFIRRMPRTTPITPGGPLYNRSAVESVAVTRATNEVSVDGQLTEWNRATFFKSACEPPYAATYFVEGGMMYDATHLYVAAHVGDPEPMRNASREGFQFAGGSVIVRLSTDRQLGWPLKGINPIFRPANPSRELLADSTNERVTSLILWHDAKSGRASLGLQHSFELESHAAPPAGWKGAFQKDADGLGYTLEYAIPWRLLHCESDPPRAGDVMGALWTVHWSDADGRICFGQLVDVTNQNPPASPTPPPPAFFLSGPHWGRAVFQSEAAKK
jgi:hypothetical protein